MQAFEEEVDDREVEQHRGEPDQRQPGGPRAAPTEAPVASPRLVRPDRPGDKGERPKDVSEYRKAVGEGLQCVGVRECAEVAAAETGGTRAPRLLSFPPCPQCEINGYPSLSAIAASSVKVLSAPTRT